MIKDFLAPLMDSWFEYEWRLPDHLRGTGRLGELITDYNFYIYPITNQEWLIFSADTIYILGNHQPAVVRQIIKEKMDQLGIGRLTAYVPAGAGDYVGYLKQIGFHVEGRMEHATVYNDQLSDVVVMGFLLHYKKGRKRNRRSRRV